MALAQEKRGRGREREPWLSRPSVIVYLDSSHPQGSYAKHVWVSRKVVLSDQINIFI